MTNCLELPRSDCPTCIGPRIFQYVNSASDVLAENSTSYWPDLCLGQDEAIKGSCKFPRRRCSLNFDDLSTAVSFLTGRGHAGQAQYGLMFVLDEWSPNHLPISWYFLHQI